MELEQMSMTEAISESPLDDNTKELAPKEAEEVTETEDEKLAEEETEARKEEAGLPSATDIAALSARIEELEAELERREELSERMTRECEEFEQYFPDISLRTLPESVWERVHAGVPLAAAYALYERGVQNQKKQTEEREARAASCSLGLPGAAEGNYFSPAQVRAMSRREVRDNYDRIFESMRHWQ